MQTVIPIVVKSDGSCGSSNASTSAALNVVQHTSAEFLGLIEDHLEGRGVRFRYCRPFAGKTPLPRENALGDGLILLGGGPWGSAGERDVPTLAQEIALDRKSVV